MPYSVVLSHHYPDYFLFLFMASPNNANAFINLTPWK